MVQGLARHGASRGSLQEVERGTGGMLQCSVPTSTPPPTAIFDVVSSEQTAQPGRSTPRGQAAATCCMRGVAASQAWMLTGDEMAGREGVEARTKIAREREASVRFMAATPARARAGASARRRRAGGVPERWWWGAAGGGSSGEIGNDDLHRTNASWCCRWRAQRSAFGSWAVEGRRGNWGHGRDGDRELLRRRGRVGSRTAGQGHRRGAAVRAAG